MKIALVTLFLTVGLLGGCIMTTTQGTYGVTVSGPVENGVEVRGNLHASAFVKWEETRYGGEPRALVRLVIAGLITGVESQSYEVRDIRFTRYEAGNYIGWSAIVAGNEDVLRSLKDKIGRRTEGDFSFTEDRLLEKRRE